eukprot:GILK01007128.1.p1 GENE.GILK01007128.1~~GILK01007128.1.p1  ORF type:complete len:367 (+),score=45.10 GILK01007128.1:41-1102(+)
MSANRVTEEQSDGNGDVIDLSFTSILERDMLTWTIDTIISRTKRSFRDIRCAVEMVLRPHGLRAPMDDWKMFEMVARMLPDSEFAQELYVQKGYRWSTLDKLHDKTYQQNLCNTFESTLSIMDDLILFKFPSHLAAKDRFETFQKQITVLTHQGARTFLSIPCGNMRELLGMRYIGFGKKLKFIGVDQDESALESAKALAQHNLHDVPLDNCQFLIGDPLHPGITPDRQFGSESEAGSRVVDVILSHGLNEILSNSQCSVFYKNMFNCLVPGGAFICSHSAPVGEWGEDINSYHMSIQRLVLHGFIGIRSDGQVRSTSQVVSQLEKAGFVGITLTPSTSRMSVTFVAYKPLTG